MPGTPNSALIRALQDDRAAAHHDVVEIEEALAVLRPQQGVVGELVGALATAWDPEIWRGRAAVEARGAMVDEQVRVADAAADLDDVVAEAAARAEALAEEIAGFDAAIAAELARAEGP